MFFSQENAIIPMCSVGTLVSSHPTFESFHMKGYDHATMIFMFDTTMTASATLNVQCGSSDAASTANNATIHYRQSAGTIKAASADIFGAIASSSVLGIATANAAGKCLVIELDAEDLPTASKTYEWVTASLSGGASGQVAAIAILSKYRYADNVMNTAIA